MVFHGGNLLTLPVYNSFHYCSYILIGLTGNEFLAPRGMQYCYFWSQWSGKEMFHFDSVSMVNSFTSIPHSGLLHYFLFMY